MKKFTTGLLAGIILTSSVTTFAAGGKMIEVFENVKKIVVDNSYKPFNNNTKPFVHNGTTYVPLRFVADALGKNVNWDGKTGTIYIGGDSSQQNNPYIDLLGTWEGTSYNSNGEQGNTFTIYQNKYGELEAIREMYPLSTNLGGNTGKILLSVEYNQNTKVIEFKHKERLEGNYDSVGFRAVVSNGTMSGNQTDWSSRKLNLKKVK